MNSASSPTVSPKALALIPALVAGLCILILSGLADLFISSWPPRLSEGGWRFRAFGQILAQAPQLTLLAVLLVLAGLVGAFRPAIRGAAVLAMVLAVISAILVPFFALDFLQQRRLVQIAQRTMYDRAAMKTGALALLLVPFLLWVGWRSWQASAVPKEASRSRKTKGDGLIVGQDAQD